MKEHYVSYEQSVALKRLGFDWKCDHYYEFNNNSLKESTTYSPSPQTFRVSEFWHNFNKYEYDRHGQPFNPEYSAPRLDQAAAWIREVKGIHIAVAPYCKENNSDTNICNAEDCFWSMELSSVPFGYWLNVSKGEFDTYELALSAGIDKALELLTDNQTDK